MAAEPSDTDGHPVNNRFLTKLPWSASRASKRSRALELHPPLHRRPLPLMSRIPRELVGHGVGVGDEPLQHDRKVGVGDAPLAKQIRRFRTQETIGGVKELVGRL